MGLERGSGWAGGMGERVLVGVRLQLGADTFRISEILPYHLDLLRGDEAGSHAQDYRILLSVDVWRNLELIVEGKASEVSPYESFIAVSASHHEHIHAAGPKRVGRVSGYVSIREGTAAEKNAARLLEEAVTELWNKRHYFEFVRELGLAQCDPRLETVSFHARYPAEVAALEAVVSALSLQTGGDENLTLGLMARHVPDTRPPALASYFIEEYGAPGTALELLEKT